MSEDEWDDKPKVEDFLYLVGKSYTFDDGDSIEVIQVKRRDDGPWVTVHITQGPGIPRKLVMRTDEFVESYGHLFEIAE
jgi:hypothetical protein